MLDWFAIGCFIVGLYIGSNIPKAWQQWKAGIKLVEQKEIERLERLKSTQ